MAIAKPAGGQGEVENPQVSPTDKPLQKGFLG